jgi:glucosamine kinase
MFPVDESKVTSGDASGLHVLCVDLGKTTCRTVVSTASEEIARIDVDGVAASADGGGEAADRILAAIARLPAAILASVAACGVGAAGTLTDPSAARRIADVLSTTLHRPTAVTSDIVTAHLGAFTGETGVVLVAGTGAVAIGLDRSGGIRRIDGWGPDIGDIGSGSWIGRRGIRAVLSARSGRGPTTTMDEALTTLTAGADPVQWVASAGNAARQLARFAPAVLDAAQMGDPAAGTIARDAVNALAATTMAATTTDSQTTGRTKVATLGGLTAHDWFKSLLVSKLQAEGFIVRPPDRDAVHGAYLAAINSELPHERHIHRA